MGLRVHVGGGVAVAETTATPTMNLYGGRTIDRIAYTRDDAEMERLLTRFRPGFLAITGTGGLLLILYLMLFKPTL